MGPGAAGLPRLSGLSEPARRALWLERNALVMTRFPFFIGRRPDTSREKQACRNDLPLADRAPFKVSRRHCAVERDGDGRYWLRDCGSTTGTFVDGRLVGGSASEQRVALEAGSHELVLGGPSSPFRFRLTFSPPGA